MGSYEQALKSHSAHVKDLESKSRLISAFEKYAAEHVPFSVVMDNITKIIPKEVRLNQISLKEGVLNLQGDADNLDAAHAFQTGLSQAGCFQKVKLEGIDKRPTETAEVVSFRMTMEVKR